MKKFLGIFYFFIAQVAQANDAPTLLIQGGLGLSHMGGLPEHYTTERVGAVLPLELKFELTPHVYAGVNYLLDSHGYTDAGDGEIDRKIDSRVRFVDLTIKGDAIGRVSPYGFVGLGRARMIEYGGEYGGAAVDIVDDVELLGAGLFFGMDGAGSYHALELSSVFYDRSELVSTHLVYKYGWRFD
ncbi:hypothetical protein GCM10011297_21060 [Bacterioplanes sanyensis]|uniref:hypothetical protein n=1 Tax=Bacterioplanes sanyensis TaxID=1249553 RepID=UPI00167A9F90|nr:hypothetical protein [Bacterioplanes sanyensis]GGY47983.1 hypothetical protein GCM10011297_21060 [Bacterioplanes sanyensis]